jgi:hypothetical protein
MGVGRRHPGEDRGKARNSAMPEIPEMAAAIPSVADTEYRICSEPAAAPMSMAATDPTLLHSRGLSPPAKVDPAAQNRTGTKRRQGRDRPRDRQSRCPCDGKTENDDVPGHVCREDPAERKIAGRVHQSG